MGSTLTVWLILALLCYFLPAIIAISRGHKDAVGIAALNILLGWTVFGWIIGFIWSLSDAKGRHAGQTVVVNTAHHSAAGPALAATEPREVDADTAFWDRLIDKNDSDALEEYLLRFPKGRFAGLARTRLERASILRKPEPRDVGRIGSADCPGCGAPWEAGSRFCSECGMAETTAGQS